ncbi:hypothetical protein H9P43_007573 [Blastocladiella emersonii ATCC 22665]|nr:hypothetical protein H9P43_007573 [Blastocladiella emersonii ATCC 22665]
MSSNEPSAVGQQRVNSAGKPLAGSSGQLPPAPPADATGGAPPAAAAQGSAATLAASSTNALQSSAAVDEPEVETPEAAAARAAAEAAALSSQQIALSSAELAAAFLFLSSDGQRVTRTEIRDFLAFYFPDLPEKLTRALLGGNTKEDREISLPTLVKVLHRKKDMARATYGDLSKLIAANYHVPSNDGVVMAEPAVRGCIATANQLEPIVAPGDFEALMARLDLDADGSLGVEDWKHIRTLCEADPKIQRILDSL